MKKIFLFIWQFPQNILGKIMSKQWKKWFKPITGKELDWIKEWEKELNVKIYAVTEESHEARPLLRGISSHSWGRRICIVFDPDLTYTAKMIKHEYGHSIQSKHWGWFYLPVVGLVSAIRNIRCRIKDDWTGYYEGFPEKQADRLGCVKR